MPERPVAREVNREGTAGEEPRFPCLSVLSWSLEVMTPADGIIIPFIVTTIVIRRGPSRVCSRSPCREPTRPVS